MLEFDGSKLKKLRKARRLTQTDLAQKVGKRVEHISNYENGYATPPSDTRLNLLTFFQIPARGLSRTKKKAESI